MNQVYGILEALIQAVKNLFKKRITIRYPEVNLKIDRGYSYDPKAQVGIPGYRGRHILYLDKCTGCSLCAIACQNIANCISMVKLDVSYPQNKKSIFPQIDYGNCVFCGFCVDACPFYALFMTDDHELSTTDKKSLIMSPLQLSIPPQKKRGIVQLKIDDRGPYHEAIE
ncbi:NADH-quinone oxidoreductase subunit I [archaeon HR06]|nr:NADH-quinone oxidoreductase subunit I [archaeon HR06]